MTMSRAGRLFPIIVLLAVICTICQIDILDKNAELRQEAIESLYVEENVEVEEVVEDNKKNAVISDRDLIERVIAAEARGDTFRGIMAVAQTIKDRGDLWNMTYEEVVTAPGQFAEPYQGEISDNVKCAVELVFDEGVRVTEEPITHFHATYVAPSWTADKVSRGTIGAHRFYY